MDKGKYGIIPNVGRNKSPDDFNEDELRWMLVEKRRVARQERLDRFRRAGRTVFVAPDINTKSLNDLRSNTLPDDEPDHTRGKRFYPSRRRRFLDVFLLIVEIAAVVILLLLLFNGLNLLQELNKEVASALELPTLTPTPLIVAAVLPSGHTPPDAQGHSQFNEAEIPSHLRSQIDSLSILPVPTSSPEQAIRVQISAIQVDAPIVQGDGWEQLKKGVGQHINSINPGENGNLVLSAHNDIFGEIFRDLDNLKPGDEIKIFTNQNSYTYNVTETKIVEPTAVEVMDSTSRPTITLISCYPYLVDNERVVVTGHLDDGN